jgi:diguanylate cyclase (GGDEF)-like protein
MLLFLAVGAIVIITVFVYSILRLVLMQKKANKELSRLNEQLYELATTDSMTQLFNRRHFIESAQRQIIQLQRTGAYGAMLMIDIDDFKGVNDSFGHAMGDECIANVASILKDNLREYDLVGRVGGEEYAMLLSQCELDRASQIAERLREKIADMSVSHQQDTINITISIGLTMIQKGENEIDKALQTADIALYKAKSMGKNRVVIC